MDLALSESLATVWEVARGRAEAGLSGEPGKPGETGGHGSSPDSRTSAASKLHQ